MANVNDAIYELLLLTTCRCEDAWTDRGLHDPHCVADYRPEVEALVTALTAPSVHASALEPTDPSPR